MPGLSGPRLAHELKERFPRLKVLVMSGYTDEATPVDGMSPRRYAFLQKPFTPAMLTDKVRRVLDGEAV
jgi:DNA-binding NtrC family response regulator